MIPLLALAAIGAVAGGMGGALTNGLDGFVLGGCAGFVLGVVAWVTENIGEHQAQELSSNEDLYDYRRSVMPMYEQPHSGPKQQNERNYIA